MEQHDGPMARDGIGAGPTERPASAGFALRGARSPLRAPISLEALVADLPGARRGGIAGAGAGAGANGGFDGVTCHVVDPRRTARTSVWPAGIHPAVLAALARRGIEAPYSHQAQALAQVLAGDDVVVVSPTAGGKSLCYAAPIVSRALADPASRALLVFPTKALAMDQAQALHELVAAAREEMRAASLAASGGEPPQVPVATFDGDTPADVRRAIRERGRIVVTNPDMLHAGILPHHAKWAAFFQGLGHVVLDELHVHRGIFGSHVANVIRRLRRVAEFHGSRPTFVTCSATIANPLEQATALLGAAPRLVEGDGAPRGERHVVLYNPPIVHAELGLRGSALSASRRLALRALEGGYQVIVFASSRLHVELLTRYLKDQLARRGRDPAGVEAYRGGLLPKARREVQRRLRAGDLRCVVATNALELGLDIGSLDVAILCGYPGSVASTWQQMGRAGRRGGSAACILVARGTPLDQHVVTHPELILGAPFEHARLDPDNLPVLVDHLKCAAFELPFREGDRFGSLSSDDTAGLLGVLAEEGFVLAAGGTWHWTHESHPAEAISLRAASSDNFVVVDAGQTPPRVVAEVDFASAPTTIHEKAIYMAGARTFQVDRLDYAGRKAFVSAVESDHYTDAISYRSVSVLESFEERGSRPPGAARISHGEVRVARKAVGFKKLKFYTSENLGYGDISLPEQEMHTTSYWFTATRSMLDGLAREGFSRRQVVEGLLGAANALHAMACLLLAADTRDIESAVGDARGTGSRSATESAVADGWFLGDGPRGSSLRSGSVDPAGAARELDTASFEAMERFEPTLFLYDNHPGGVGFSPLLFDQHRRLVGMALDRIGSCSCGTGCPACVGPRQDSSLPCRAAALRLLEVLAADSPPADAGAA